MPYRVDGYRYLSGRMIELNNDRLLPSGLVAPKSLGRIAVVSANDPVFGAVQHLPNPSLSLERISTDDDYSALDLAGLVRSSIKLLREAADGSQSQILAVRSQLACDLPYNQRLAMCLIADGMGVINEYWTSYLAPTAYEGAFN